MEQPRLPVSSPDASAGIPIPGPALRPAQDAGPRPDAAARDGGPSNSGSDSPLELPPFGEAQLSRLSPTSSAPTTPHSPRIAYRSSSTPTHLVS